MKSHCSHPLPLYLLFLIIKSFGAQQNLRLSPVSSNSNSTRSSIHQLETISSSGLEDAVLSKHFDKQLEKSLRGHKNVTNQHRLFLSRGQWQLHHTRRQINWDQSEEDADTDEQQTMEHSANQAQFDQFIPVAPNVQTSIGRSRNHLHDKLIIGFKQDRPKSDSDEESSQQQQLKLELPRTWSIDRTIGAVNGLRTSDREYGANTNEGKVEIRSDMMTQQPHIWTFASTTSSHAAHSRRAKTMSATSTIVATTSTGSPQKTEEKNQNNRSNRSYVNVNHEQQWTNVRAPLGGTARLLCRLRSSANAQDSVQISWMKDVQILTNGEERHTIDERFKPVHSQHSNDWILEIHNVTTSDEGDYLCQTDSGLRPTSSIVHLRVVSAYIKITDASDIIHVPENEQIKLTCQVRFYLPTLERLHMSYRPEERAHSNENSPDGSNSSQAMLKLSPLSENKTDEKRMYGLTDRHTTSLLQGYYIYWYKDSSSLEYNNPRGGVYFERMNNDSIGLMESVVLVDRVTRSDGGVYMCKLFPQLSDIRPAEVRVSVSSFAVSCAPSNIPLLVVQLSHLLLTISYCPSKSNMRSRLPTHVIYWIFTFAIVTIK